MYWKNRKCFSKDWQHIYEGRELVSESNVGINFIYLQETFNSKNRWVPVLLSFADLLLGVTVIFHLKNVCFGDNSVLSYLASQYAK